MVVFPGSLILKVQLALYANKMWKLLSIFFSSVLDSNKTLPLLGQVKNLNPFDGVQIVNFITNLLVHVDQHHIAFFLFAFAFFSFCFSYNLTIQ